MDERSEDNEERGRSRFAAVKARAVPASRDEVQELRERVAELEDEVQQARRLHLRVAELTDIVQELLVPLAQRDEDKVREYLDRYSPRL